MADTLLGHDMLIDGAFGGLLGLHDLQDLVSACPPRAPSAFRSHSLDAQGGAVASRVRSRDVPELRAANLENVALVQRRAPPRSRSFDAWLSPPGGDEGVSGRLEQQLGRDCLPLRQVDLFDGDALLLDDCAPAPDGFDLTAAYSCSSTDSSTTTLASAISCTHSSAANSGSDLTSLVQTSPAWCSPRPSLPPPPMNGLHFECLPDTPWLGFELEVSGAARSLDSCPTEPAASRVLLGRPCSPELPECSRGRAGGCGYLIGAGGLKAQPGSRSVLDAASEDVLDAPSVGLLPGSSAGSSAGAYSESRRLYAPAFRSTHAARLVAERMQPKDCPPPASVLPGWTLPTSHPVPVRGSLTDFLAWGDIDDLPAAFLSARLRSTQSGMLERPGNADGAPDSTSRSSQAPRDAAAASAQVHVPTAAQPPTAQGPEAPATMAAAASHGSAVWTSSLADMLCSKHDAGRSLLDKAVRGGSPRGSRGALALHALAACRWPVDGCLADDFTSTTAPAQVPAAVISPHDAEALVGEPASAVTGSGGAEALGALPFDASLRRRRPWVPGSPYDCMGAAAGGAIAESHSGKEGGHVGGGGNLLGHMEKAELEVLRAAPTWALLLVLAERWARGVARMHASALWAAMLPWSALLSFAQRLLFPDFSAAGSRLHWLQTSPTTPVRRLEEPADVPVREVP